MNKRLQDQIAFFEKNHYLQIPNGLTRDEIERVNAAIDRNRQQYPTLWGKGNRMQSVQCFLVMPELDFLIRHPSFFPRGRARAGWRHCFFPEFSAMIPGWEPNPGNHRRLAIVTSNPIRRAG